LRISKAHEVFRIVDYDCKIQEGQLKSCHLLHICAKSHLLQDWNRCETLKVAHSNRKCH